MSFVGMPAFLHLSTFAQAVEEVFGELPYLTGSAMHRKDWRDVDVRLILPDKKYAEWFGSCEHPQWTNPKWNTMCCAFSALGRSMTGLPIDFQIQWQSHVNEHFPASNGFRREVLGLIIRSEQ